MFSRLRAWLAGFRTQLTVLGEDEPLSKFSIALVLLLDAFLVALLFAGLAEHTAQLTSPDERISYSCRELADALQDGRRLVAAGGSALPASRASENAARSGTVLVETIRSGVSDSIEYRRYDEIALPDAERAHPACLALRQAAVAARADETVAALYRTYDALATDRSKAENDIETLRSSYDSALLEKIAGQSETDSILPGRADSIKAEIAEKNAEIAELAANAEKTARSILAAPSVAALATALVPRYGDDYSGWLRSEYDRLAFWFPLREFGMQMLFLLPLLVFASWWQRASVRRAARVQTLIASHLLFVALIPVVWRVADLVIELIPHALLQEIFAFFARFDLVGVWYYLVGFVAVALTVFVVRVAERRFFSRERLAAKRLGRGECVHCGRRLPPHETCPHCPHCGTGRYEACPVCRAPSFVLARNCQACGAEKPKAE